MKKEKRKKSDKLEYSLKRKPDKFRDYHSTNYHRVFLLHFLSYLFWYSNESIYLFCDVVWNYVVKIERENEIKKEQIIKRYSKSVLMLEYINDDVLLYQSINKKRNVPIYNNHIVQWIPWCNKTMWKRKKKEIVSPI